jgi:hypothetical protein
MQLVFHGEHTTSREKLHSMAINTGQIARILPVPIKVTTDNSRLKAFLKKMKDVGCTPRISHWVGDNPEVIYNLLDFKHYVIKNML